ncbi:MAG: DNA-directed RNA polymerase subunit delta [Syntrophomonadaceae bacterium]|nr:DNA-directed RNA polymerase subunit delta [Syntrophomonadaceae bacterium]
MTEEKKSTAKKKRAQDATLEPNEQVEKAVPPKAAVPKKASAEAVAAETEITAGVDAKPPAKKTKAPKTKAVGEPVVEAEPAAVEAPKKKSAAKKKAAAVAVDEEAAAAAEDQATPVKKKSPPKKKKAAEPDEVAPKPFKKNPRKQLEVDLVPRKKSEADWAVEVMRERMEPVFYSDLVKEIAKRMDKAATESNLSTIYTRLNLDNRLIYQGDGFWYFDENRLYR